MSSRGTNLTSRYYWRRTPVARATAAPVTTSRPLGEVSPQKSWSALQRPACCAPGSRIWTLPYAGTLRLLSHASIARGSKRRRPATLRYGIRPARHRRRMLSGCSASNSATLMTFKSFSIIMTFHLLKYERKRTADHALVQVF